MIWLSVAVSGILAIEIHPILYSRSRSFYLCSRWSPKEVKKSELRGARLLILKPKIGQPQAVF